MTLMTHPSPIPWLYEMHPENGRVYHFPCLGPDPNAGHLDPAAAERSPGRRPNPAQSIRGGSASASMRVKV